MTKEESIKKAVSILLTHIVEEGGEVTIRIGNSPPTYLEHPFPPRHISKEEEPVKKAEPVKDLEPTVSGAPVRKRVTKAPAPKKPIIISVFPGVGALHHHGLHVVTPGDDLLTTDRGDSDVVLEKMYSYEGEEYMISPHAFHSFFDAILRVYESSDEKYIVVPFGKVVFDCLDKMDIPFCIVYPEDNEDNREAYFDRLSRGTSSRWQELQKSVEQANPACCIELRTPSDGMQEALSLIEECQVVALSAQYKGCLFRVDNGKGSVEVDEAAANMFVKAGADIRKDAYLNIEYFLELVQKVELWTSEEVNRNQ